MPTNVIVTRGSRRQKNTTFLVGSGPGEEQRNRKMILRKFVYTNLPRRAVTKTLIGGAYSYICVLPDEFLLKSTVMATEEKALKKSQAIKVFDTLLAIKTKLLTVKCLTYTIYLEDRKLCTEEFCLTTETWQSYTP